MLIAPTLFFIVFATLACIGIGWLIQRGMLPFNSTIAFNSWQLKFLNVWVQVALMVGVIFPIILLFIFWDETFARQFLLLYLLAVVIQLISEATLSRWLCPSIVVFIGTIYTIFRLWQVWTGMHLSVYSPPWLTMLWSILLFWVANLIMLVFMAFPNIASADNIMDQS
jgi:hypothetical protein